MNEMICNTKHLLIWRIVVLIKQAINKKGYLATNNLDRYLRPTYLQGSHQKTDA